MRANEVSFYLPHMPVGTGEFEGWEMPPVRVLHGLPTGPLSWIKGLGRVVTAHIQAKGDPPDTCPGCYFWKEIKSIGERRTQWMD